MLVRNPIPAPRWIAQISACLPIYLLSCAQQVGWDSLLPLHRLTTLDKVLRGKKTQLSGPTPQMLPDIVPADSAVMMQ